FQHNQPQVIFFQLLLIRRTLSSFNKIVRFQKAASPMQNAAWRLLAIAAIVSLVLPIAAPATTASNGVVESTIDIQNTAYPSTETQPSTAEPQSDPTPMGPQPSTAEPQSDSTPSGPQPSTAEPQSDSTRLDLSRALPNRSLIRPVWTSAEHCRTAV
uniref:Secreted protein n=1 Tax=Macrostomum lignano TaxID=282301 RepID=A0A1I8HB90_9PLAT